MDKSLEARAGQVLVGHWFNGPHAFPNRLSWGGVTLCRRPSEGGNETVLSLGSGQGGQGVT